MSEKATTLYATYETVPAYEKAVWNGTDLMNRASELPLWSGKNPPPAIGTSIRIEGDTICTHKVVGYFRRMHWIGVLALLDTPANHGEEKVPRHVFGVEFEEIEEEADVA